MLKDSSDFVRDVAERVEVILHLKVIKDPEGDNRVLECAVDGKADFVVSGDTKHIFPLREYEGIKILSPSDFVKLLPITIPSFIPRWLGVKSLRAVAQKPDSKISETLSFDE